MTPPTALDLPAVDPLPEATARYFDLCQKKLGLVPNVLRAYAHDIGKLDAFTAFFDQVMLAESARSKLEREMIAVVVSAENQCHYCLVAHGAALRSLSGRPDWAATLATNWRMAALSPREPAMLPFAVKVTRQSAEIGDLDRDALRDVGFADADIWDIAAVAGFFAMSNRLASATGMRPNPEYFAQAR